MTVWQQTAQLILSAALFFCLLRISYTDLTQRRLPNRQVAVIAGLGLLRLLPLVSSLLGALYAVGVAVLVAGAYRLLRGQAGIGMGDLKLLAALGLFFGPPAFWILPLASCLCVVSLPLIVWRRGSLTSLPFGPYIAIGAIILMAPMVMRLLS